MKTINLHTTPGTPDLTDDQRELHIVARQRAQFIRPKGVLRVIPLAWRVGW